MSALASLVVVDAKPRSRDTIAFAFEREGYRVYATGDAREALTLAQRRAPELVVASTALGPMGPLEFLETLRAEVRRQPAVVVVGGEHARAETLAAGASEYVPLPAFLRDVVTVGRIAVAVRRGAHPAEGGSREVIDGPLEDYGLYFLSRALVTAHRSARVQLWRDGGGRDRYGELLFTEGRIAGARLGRQQGESAFQHLLLWEEGRVRVDFIRPEEPERRIDKPTAQVLDEAARFRAELAAMAERVGGIEAVWVREEARISDVQRQIPPEVMSLLASYDGGRRLLDVVEDSPFRPFDTVVITHRLATLGAIARVEEPPRREQSEIDDVKHAVRQWLRGEAAADPSSVLLIDGEPAEAMPPTRTAPVVQAVPREVAAVERAERSVIAAPPASDSAASVEPPAAREVRPEQRMFWEAAEELRTARRNKLPAERTLTPVGVPPVRARRTPAAVPAVPPAGRSGRTPAAVPAVSFAEDSAGRSAGSTESAPAIEGADLTASAPSVASTGAIAPAGTSKGSRRSSGRDEAGSGEKAPRRAGGRHATGRRAKAPPDDNAPELPTSAAVEERESSPALWSGRAAKAPDRESDRRSSSVPAIDAREIRSTPASVPAVVEARREVRPTPASVPAVVEARREVRPTPASVPAVVEARREVRPTPASVPAVVEARREVRPTPASVPAVVEARRDLRATPSSVPAVVEAGHGGPPMSSRSNRTPPSVPAAIAAAAGGVGRASPAADAGGGTSAPDRRTPPSVPAAIAAASEAKRTPPSVPAAVASEWRRAPASSAAPRPGTDRQSRITGEFPRVPPESVGPPALVTSFLRRRPEAAPPRDAETPPPSSSAPPSTASRVRRPTPALDAVDATRAFQRVPLEDVQARTSQQSAPTAAAGGEPSSRWRRAEPSAETAPIERTPPGSLESRRGPAPGDGPRRNEVRNEAPPARSQPAPSAPQVPVPKTGAHAPGAPSPSRKAAHDAPASEHRSVPTKPGNPTPAAGRGAAAITEQRAASTKPGHPTPATGNPPVPATERSASTRPGHPAPATGRGPAPATDERPVVPSPRRDTPSSAHRAAPPSPQRSGPTPSEAAPHPRRGEAARTGKVGFDDLEEDFFARESELHQHDAVDSFDDLSTDEEERKTPQPKNPSGPRPRPKR